ncbi:SDR family NAD(P)-dependent oxidoreductase [Flavisphingomonas formosensis]|uniref:SDR family NAD(P)-dependent oxidoreductase n=1 Tax=Flavisphingomonas formosensis TaxID=861534 RepID=UPI0012F83D15|nr:glucose 1-dehydrogenase [Sphingomonas formosensis]
MPDVKVNEPRLLLEGKVALITGAGGGIGSTTARIFAREGARLILSDVDRDLGEAIRKEIVDAGGEASFFAANVAKAEECEAMVAHAEESFGRLDIAFNNAGHIGVYQPFKDYPLSEYERIIDVNIRGTWNCLRAEIPLLLKNRGGAIVNMSSTAGIVGSAGAAPYVMAKHAITGLTKAVALDYVKDNIRVNAVLPGAVDTAMPRRLVGGDEAILAHAASMIPQGRFATAEEVGEMVAFLCSDRSGHTTGGLFLVDGGLTAA